MSEQEVNEMSRFKFGIVEWALPAEGRYGCEVAHRAGLQGIQVNIGSYETGYHLSNKEMQRMYLEAGQKWEIEFPSLAVNCLCDIGMTRREGTKEREIAKQSIKIGIDTAQQMGISLVMLPTFHDGYIKDEEDFRLTVECVREACQYAYDKNIKIALENVMSTDEYFRFKDQVGMENLGIIYDNQNYSVCKGYDDTQIYREIRDEVDAIHVKDGFDEMSTHMLGEGGCNFFKTAEEILKSDYSGWIFAENYFDQLPLREKGDPYELLRQDVITMKNAFKA